MTTWRMRHPEDEIELRRVTHKAEARIPTMTAMRNLRRASTLTARDDCPACGFVRSCDQGGASLSGRGCGDARNEEAARASAWGREWDSESGAPRGSRGSRLAGLGFHRCSDRARQSVEKTMRESLETNVDFHCKGVDIDHLVSDGVGHDGSVWMASDLRGTERREELQEREREGAGWGGTRKGGERGG